MMLLFSQLNSLTSAFLATAIDHYSYILKTIKGVLHPRPVFGLFLHFPQRIQHIGNKSDMFPIGNISRNLITALEFH